MAISGGTGFFRLEPHLRRQTLSKSLTLAKLMFWPRSGIFKRLTLISLISLYNNYSARLENTMVQKFYKRPNPPKLEIHMNLPWVINYI
jgi:hypothetical protein